MAKRIIMAVLLSIFLVQSALAENNYKIIGKQDVSYTSPKNFRKVSRLSYKIKVNPPITKDKLRSISNTIISQNNVNAIIFFFYLQNTDSGGHYAGRVIWAPNGKWRDANSNAPHLFNIVLVKTHFYKKSSLSIPEKKKIFYELVKMP